MGAATVRLLKGADRILGRAVYRHFLKRRLSHPPEGDGRLAEPVRAILVIRPGGIGDAVLFFPLLAALREAYPQARLEVLAERRNVGLFAANDVADRAWAYDRGAGGELARVLRRSYDVVVDTEQYHFLSAIVAWRTGAPVRVGFDTQGRGGLFTHRVRYSDQVYEVRSFLALARALTGREWPFDPEQPFFPVADEHREWARGLLGRSAVGRLAGDPVAIVSPGASMPQRVWDPARYRRLVGWLCEQGLRVVVIGGAGDVVAAQRVAEGFDPARVIVLAGQASLARTAAVIAAADLYVSADTGPLHIAYGVGTPTVHLFGSGILEKWAPAGSRYRAVHKALPCSPCTRYGYTPPCPYGVECMRRIEVEDVIEKAREVLAGPRTASPIPPGPAPVAGKGPSA